MSIGIVTDDLKRQIDFSPNSSHTFSYAVRATTPGDVRVSLIDENEVNLSRYISLEPDIFKGTVEGSIYHFKVHLELPEQIEIPGPHTVKVKVEETDLEAEGSVVAAKSSSTAKLTVHIPYPGKYIRITRFSIPHKGEGEPVAIELDAKNLGTQEIQKAEGRITVFSLDRDLPLKSLTTGTRSLAPQEQASFNAAIDASELKAGKYKAEAKIKYDGTFFTDAKTAYFNIGTLDVRVLNNTKVLQKKNIQKMTILVENSWNNRIDGVWAELLIGGYQDLIKTPSIDLGPFEANNLEAYIDTARLDLGRHDATVVLHYEGSKKNVPIWFELIEPAMSEEQSPADVSVGGIPISLLTIVLVLIALILIVMNLNLYRKKKKEDKKKKNNKDKQRKG
jgi:hypothetical protein